MSDPQLLQLLCEAQAKREEGKAECKALQQQLQALNQRIIFDMRRNKLTALQLADHAYLLLSKVSKERVVKPAVIDQEMMNITQAECTAMHQQLQEKRHPPLTTVQVYNAVLKKRLKQHTTTVSYRLTLAKKVRKGEVATGQMLQSQYVQLHDAYHTAKAKRKLAIQQAAAKQREAVRRGRALLQRQQRVLVPLPPDDDDGTQSMCSGVSTATSMLSTLSRQSKKKVSMRRNRLPSPPLEEPPPSLPLEEANLIIVPMEEDDAPPLQLEVRAVQLKAEPTKPLSAHRAIDIVQTAMDEVVGGEAFSIPSLQKVWAQRHDLQETIAKDLKDRGQCAMKNGVSFNVTA